ncbi:Sulfotransferase 1C4 [Chionoecetes opilio]|uniref:Sulfotransferase 1C4 n=1 Tax=Chionoecetes opilio TaxID=41210 RepID=A0A8J4Y3E6_CHIOP|nr:Sulfotransferase 1C4 [Chionoecetes opilio]
MRNNPNLDNPMAALPINAKVPFLEMDPLLNTKNNRPFGPDHPLLQGFKKACPGRDPKDGVFLQMTECAPSPRSFKTHLPLSLLPPNLLATTKAVYMARNPKDVVLSFLHHSRILRNHAYVGTLEQFVQYFLDGDLRYGPFWLHLKEAWEQKDNPNLLFMFYEELKQNTLPELKRLNDFLGTKLTQEQLESVAHYTSFPEMKARDGLVRAGALDIFNSDIVKKDGGLFRKGEVGDWKGKFTPELSAKMDQWNKTNLADLGINFKYGA